MNTVLLKEFKDLCKKVVMIKTKPGAMIDYARSYAHAGLDLYSNEEIKSQIPYILANLSTWRGESARGTKKAFNELQKALRR